MSFTSIHVPNNGRHPRTMHGMPMPDYLYRFYGLEKSNEIASEVVHLCLAPADKADITRRARKANLSLSDYLRRKALSDD